MGIHGNLLTTPAKYSDAGYTDIDEQEKLCYELFPYLCKKLNVDLDCYIMEHDSGMVVEFGMYNLIRYNYEQLSLKEKQEIDEYISSLNFTYYKNFTEFKTLWDKLQELAKDVEQFEFYLF